MKTKKQLTYWLSVIVIGIALGLAIQFVRAWTEPTEAPPGGNVGAPINTGPIEQTKTGDICTTAPNGAGAKKCLSTASASATPTCGNGFCESLETTANCAVDCPPPPPPPPPPCECTGAPIWGSPVECGQTVWVLGGNCAIGGWTMTYLCSFPGTWIYLYTTGC